MRTRLTTRALLVALCLAICSPLPLLAQDTAVETPAAAVSKWEKEISGIEKKTQGISENKGRILFLGSSSIRLWDLEKAFPEWKLLNHGFGGSQISDSVDFFDRLATPYAPRLIVFYAGDNDIAAKKTPEQATKDFQKLVDLLKEKLPETKLVYIPIKPSPSRWKLFEQQKRANAAIQAIIEKDPKRLSMIDIVPAMLDAQGLPRGELFKPDNLHLNEAGYAIWAKLLQDHVTTLSKTP
jgi:lysophospholipase L1-like esterase